MANFFNLYLLDNQKIMMSKLIKMTPSLFTQIEKKTKEESSKVKEYVGAIIVKRVAKWTAYI